MAKNHIIIQIARMPKRTTKTNGEIRNNILPTSKNITIRTILALLHQKEQQ